MPNSVRRVVTGHDEQGRSIVVADGPAPFVHVNPADPEWCSTDVFRSAGAPAAIAAHPVETTEGPRRQLPTPHGTVIRVNNFRPNLIREPDELRTMHSERLLRWVTPRRRPSAKVGGSAHASTETIDFAIVVSGEITMLLDVGEVVLKAGDILIQCGTNHAWVNRSNAPAVVIFVLIDGEFEPDLRSRFSA